MCKEDVSIEEGRGDNFCSGSTRDTKTESVSADRLLPSILANVVAMAMPRLS